VVVVVVVGMRCGTRFIGVEIGARTGAVNPPPAPAAHDLGWGSMRL